MTVLDRIAAALARATILVAAAAVVIMTLHVAAGVICRSVFGVSLTGTVEVVSYYYMVFIAFAPWAFAQWMHEHIAVDALVGLMPDWMRAATQVAAALASLLVIGVVTWALADQAIRQTGYGEHVVSGAVDVPVWPARWIAVAGAAAMIVVLAAQLANPAAAGRQKHARREEGTLL
ncbi:TRAP transporter small permease [Acuticoccus sp.]|uniref:TRAP transporter small permease n=1 Tax=Acuticoccus sp. TaxID=1904378 RepID=UPI003B51991C